MKNRVKSLIALLNFWRCIPVYLMILTCRNRELILDEIKHWGKCAKIDETNIFILMSRLLVEMKEYRNLFCFRLRSGGGIARQSLAKLLFPNLGSLYIKSANIGPRLYIQHGFSTWISAKEIGSDCWINQQVTVGYTFDEEPPTIGNGVRISAGAKVVGQIRIGDNAIIAANAAVVNDVEENKIVGGVPAKVIGINDDHKLYQE